MPIDIRPDKDDRFIIVTLDGETKMVENEHQDIEFTVSTKAGARVRSGRTRADLSKALGEVREIEDDEQERAAYLELLEQLIAADQVGEVALRWTGSEIEVAELEDKNANPSEEQLEWVQWSETKIGKTPGFPW